MTTLLIYTVGGTDAQLIHEGKRWDVSRSSRAFNEQNDWSLGESNVPKASSSDCVDPQKVPAPLVFCTPKLDAVLAHTLEISRVLLLVTDRPRDPVFANRVLERRLEQSGKDVTLKPFLSGAELLEDLQSHDDGVIRREVVLRLEGAIREEIARTRPERIVVAPVGGMPMVSELVRELVRLHFDQDDEISIVDLEVPDGSKVGAQGGADRAVVRSKLDPTGVVAAKRHALALVGQGNLVAAWGAVSHLAQEKSCKPWTGLLRELAQWTSSESALQRTADLPLPKPDHRAANCALRVELALRAQDWPKAIVGTYAFYEAAVLDSMHKLALLPGTTKETYQLKWKPDQDDKALKDALKERGGGYEIVCYSSKADALCEYLRANAPQDCMALGTLADKIGVANDYRNRLAHGEPKPEVVESAKSALVSAKLWTQQGKALRFLCSPLIHNVLVELDPTHTADLADRLISFVAGTLRGTREAST